MPGPWRETRELAKQDAVRAGWGHRDGTSGLASIDPKVRFEIAYGEAGSTEGELMEGDALAILVVHGAQAEEFARHQLEVSSDSTEQDRWRSIITTIDALRLEARRG